MLKRGIAALILSMFARYYLSLYLCWILESDRKKEFYDGHGRQSNRKRLKTSDEEQQEKSFVPMSSKFEHDGAMLGCYDAGLMREDVRAE
ncbi:hypothetical protein QL285_098454 [Trifolium repens]|nr:hypothetical protein QL285_098454 [Trifolium repens]